MEFQENQTLDLKSIRKIETDKGIKDLAVCCVSFANSRGGKLYIDFEDKTHKPLPNQSISQEKHNEAIKQLRSNCYNVALESSEILETADGEQYFIISVSPLCKILCFNRATRLPDVERKDIQRQIYNMVRQNQLKTTGGKSNRRYSMA